MQGANRQISGRNPPEPRSFALHRQSEGRKQHVDLFHTYLCEHTFVMEERDASALAAGDTFSSQTAEGDEHRAQPLEPTLASFPTIPRPIARCFVALASLFDSCSNYDACRCNPFTKAEAPLQRVPSTLLQLADVRRGRRRRQRQQRWRQRHRWHQAPASRRHVAHVRGCGAAAAPAVSGQQHCGGNRARRRNGRHVGRRVGGRRRRVASCAQRFGRFVVLRNGLRNGQRNGLRNGRRIGRRIGRRGGQRVRRRFGWGGRQRGARGSGARGGED